mgnify:CR=1 FL=1
MKQTDLFEAIKNTLNVFEKQFFRYDKDGKIYELENVSLTTADLSEMITIKYLFKETKKEYAIEKNNLDENSLGIIIDCVEYEIDQKYIFDHNKKYVIKFSKVTKISDRTKPSFASRAFLGDTMCDNDSIEIEIGLIHM